MNNLSIIRPTALRALVDAGVVSQARVMMSEDQGLVVVLSMADTDCVLGSVKRPGPRYFKHMDGAASALKGHGIFKFEVDVTDWIPSTTLRLQKKQQGEKAMKE